MWSKTTLDPNDFHWTNQQTFFTISYFVLRREKKVIQYSLSSSAIVIVKITKGHLTLSGWEMRCLPGKKVYMCLFVSANIQTGTGWKSGEGNKSAFSWNPICKSNAFLNSNMSNDLIWSVQSCCESKSPLMLLSQQCISHRLLKMYEMHTLKDTYELKRRSSDFILSLQRVSTCYGYWKLWTRSPLITLICNGGGERLWPWIWHWHRANVTYQLKHLVTNALSSKQVYHNKCHGKSKPYSIS